MSDPARLPSSRARVDYFGFLSETIADLSQNTPERRAAVYERARAILRGKGLESQITSFEVGVESVALEAAIRDIERRYSGSDTSSDQGGMEESDTTASTAPDGAIDAYKLGGCLDPVQYKRRSASHRVSFLIRTTFAVLILIGVVTFALKHQADWLLPRAATVIPAVSVLPSATETGPAVDHTARSPEVDHGDNACRADNPQGCQPGAVQDERPEAPHAVPTAAPAQVPVTAPRSLIPAAQEAFEEGARLAKAAETDQALSAFGRSIKSDSNFADAYLARGLLYFRTGQIAKATADFDEAIRLNPQHAMALKSRAMTYVYADKPDLAIADFTRAIGLAGSDHGRLSSFDMFQARRGRAALYDMKQLYDSELADLSWIIDTYRRDSDLQEAVNAALGDPGAAVGIAGVYQLRAVLYVRKKRMDLAGADLSTAIDLLGQRAAGALVERAKFYESSGQTVEAKADYQHALALEPGRADAQNALKRLR